MRKSEWTVMAIAIGGLLLASPAAAQKTPKTSPLVSALSACRAIADPAQRLACFDQASESLVQAASKGDVAIVDRGEMRQARRSLFGFNLPKLPFFSGDKSAEDASDTLVSKVSSVRSTGYDRFQVRLEDGNALWETTESYGGFDAPKRGDKVEIRRGPLGSYILRFGNQRGVKGKRIG